VRDASATGHQVQLTRPHERVHAVAVAVLDLAGEEPADGLQPGVRVRGDVHLHVVRPVVVAEAPRADE
jgi:hypothetical protein